MRYTANATTIAPVHDLIIFMRLFCISLYQILKKIFNTNKETKLEKMNLLDMIMIYHYTSEKQKGIQCLLHLIQRDSEPIDITRQDPPKGNPCKYVVTTP